MKPMVILPSALANQTRQIPEAVNIFSYLFLNKEWLKSGIGPHNLKFEK
jgi:hypothetical protein